jgi:hypothetical protein
MVGQCVYVGVIMSGGSLVSGVMLFLETYGWIFLWKVLHH